MLLLQTTQSLFIGLDGGLQLLDVFCSALAKGSLRLPVALLTLF